MISALNRFRLILLLASIVALPGCESESQLENFRRVPPAGQMQTGPRQVSLEAGPATIRPAVRNPYENQPDAAAEGRRLYHWFNCAGCHFQGGGGMGPPLMDEEWIYGSEPANIFQSIIDGRPNGMPAFGGRISHDQAWKITVFVRSLADLTLETPGHRTDPLQERRNDEDDPQEEQQNDSEQDQ